MCVLLWSKTVAGQRRDNLGHWGCVFCFLWESVWVLSGEGRWISLPTSHPWTTSHKSTMIRWLGGNAKAKCGGKVRKLLGFHISWDLRLNSAEGSCHRGREQRGNREGQDFTGLGKKGNLPVVLSPSYLSCIIRDWTQGCIELHHNPFSFWFWDRVLLSYSGWPGTHNPLASVSWSVGANRCVPPCPGKLVLLNTLLQ